MVNIAMVAVFILLAIIALAFAMTQRQLLRRSNAREHGSDQSYLREVTNDPPSFFSIAARRITSGVKAFATRQDDPGAERARRATRVLFWLFVGVTLVGVVTLVFIASH
jgi:hypothetical protein